MFDMLIKQFLGDINLEEIKAQMQQFALMIVEMRNDIKAIKAHIESTTQAAEANIPLLNGTDNDNGNGN